MVIQHLAAGADPSGLSGRYADHERVVGHVGRDHRARADEGAAANRVAADDGGVGSDACAGPDARRHIVRRPLGIPCPWRQIIGKHAGGSQKYIILDLYALVHGNIVLNFDAIADDDPVGNVHILPQGAVLTDDRAGLDVAKVPDFCAAANADPVVDVAAAVYERA